MILNSWRFAAFFFLVFAIYWMIPHKYRKYVLLASNVVFCLSWGAYGLCVVIVVSLVAYFAGLRMEQREKRKKRIRTAAIILCLLPLFVFKYLNFSLRSLETAAAWLSWNFHPAVRKLIMPLGISYYTLQSVGYICDVYCGKISAEHDPVAFLAFNAFFPGISSGPITKARDILPQIKEEKYFDYDRANYAVKLIAVGLAKKLVVADGLAPYVDRVYSDLGSFSGFPLLLAQCLYLFQLYGDFSGYSDLAMGTAMLLGIDIPQNFRQPYLSTTIGEFWRRWHISLSDWLKEYIYFPLGGSRRGKVRKYMNVLITFLVSGLWHGADWSYVVWGALNGIYQMFETMFGIREMPHRMPSDAKDKPLLWGMKRWLRIVLVFFLFGFAQIFFRAGSVSGACYFLSHVFDGITSPFIYISEGLLMNNWIQGGRLSFLIRLTLCIAPLFLYDIISDRGDPIKMVTELRAPVRIVIYLLTVVYICFFRSVSGVSFVYFQF